MSETEKKSDQLNVRVHPSMLTDLEDVAAYERVGVPELVRGWIRGRLREYLGDSRFKHWLKAKEGRNLTLLKTFSENFGGKRAT